MGYTGLSSYKESDRATNLSAKISECLVTTMVDHLSENTNDEENTYPIVDVVLNLIPILSIKNGYWFNDEEFCYFLNDVIRTFGNFIRSQGEELEDSESKSWHINKYNSIMSELKTTIEDFRTLGW